MKLDDVSKNGNNLVIDSLFAAVIWDHAPGNGSVRDLKRSGWLFIRSNSPSSKNLKNKKKQDTFLSKVI